MNARTNESSDSNGDIRWHLQADRFGNPQHDDDCRGASGMGDVLRGRDRGDSGMNIGDLLVKPWLLQQRQHRERLRLRL